MASVFGCFLPTSTSQQRPVSERELRAYGGASLFRGKRVLDLGTGDGRLALGAAHWAKSVAGADPDPVAIRDAKKNARRAGVRARFVVAPAQALPFRDGEFDVVILSWSL